MRIFKGFEDTGTIINPVVTTGSFDGVHIGHKTILNRLKTLAAKHNGESVLITFDPHPRKVLYPETAGKDLKLINSQEEKLHLLREAGLDNIIIVEFTREFSRITSEEFVRDFLHNKLKARVVVAGFNHHFGFNKEGDYRQLWGWQEKYGYEAEEIPEQEVEHETVSSTRIRQAISEGYIQRANAYLDHYYHIIGTVSSTQVIKAPELSDFRRVSIEEESKLLPADGLYAVSVKRIIATERGMVLISKKEDHINRVLLYLIDGRNFSSQEKVILNFHKKVHGAIDLDDQATEQKLKKALHEISELIY
jgi:riboflavin kinase/FMN adenylyltransferase